MHLDIGYILAGLTALVWGLIVIPVKKARTSGLVGVGISMPAGVLTLLAAALVAPRDWVNLGALSWSNVLLLGLGGICQFPLATVCYYESVRLAEVSTVVPITRIETVVVVVLVALLGIESITLLVAVACLVAVSGAALLTYRREAAGAVDSANRRKGIVLALLTGVCWALGEVLIRIALRRVPALPATLLSLSLGAAVYYVLMIGGSRFRRILDMPARDKLLYALHGACSFGLGYLSFFASIRLIGVSRASIIGSAWPGVSFLVGLWLFGERLSWTKAAGFLLLMGSVVLIVR